MGWLQHNHDPRDKVKRSSHPSTETWESGRILWYYRVNYLCSRFEWCGRLHRPLVVRRNLWVQSSGGDGMPFEKPISVVIVDDHPVVRDGLSAMVSAEADIEVVAET